MRKTLIVGVAAVLLSLTVQWSMTGTAVSRGMVDAYGLSSLTKLARIVGGSEAAATASDGAGSRDVYDAFDDGYEDGEWAIDEEDEGAYDVGSSRIVVDEDRASHKHSHEEIDTAAQLDALIERDAQQAEEQRAGLLSKIEKLWMLSNNDNKPLQANTDKQDGEYEDFDDEYEDEYEYDYYDDDEDEYDDDESEEAEEESGVDDARERIESRFERIRRMSALNRKQQEQQQQQQQQQQQPPKGSGSEEESAQELERQQQQKPKEPTPEQREQERLDSVVRKIEALGFPRNMVVTAMQESKNDPGRAAAWLAANMHRFDQIEAEQRAQAERQAAAEALATAEVRAAAAAAEMQRATSSQHEERHKQLANGRRSAAASAEAQVPKYVEHRGRVHESTTRSRRKRRKYHPNERKPSTGAQSASKHGQRRGGRRGNKKASQKKGLRFSTHD